jgi:hypothetical protein
MLAALLIIAIPGVAIALFVVRFRKHLRKKAIRRSHETWAIGIFEGSTPFELHAAAGVSNPVISAKDVTDIRARFVADPFMVKGKGGLYLFFEVLNEKRNLGEIGYAFSEDGRKWHYRNIVLRERFHLSYPYVFSWEGHYYMIPECHGSGGIQLYRAKDFPGQWERISTIVKGDRNHAAIVDPSVIRHGNRWYLFSYGKNRSLHLFTAETLSGPWEEHPGSPVVTGSPQFARPGGRVIDHEGYLYRYAQDEIPCYGSRVWAFRITELTPATYREEAVSANPIVQPGIESWNRNGMHHVDPHQDPSGRWMAFVDGFSIKETTEGRPE